ncbi:MAE_28990/MAE_18760 family HEPN-like nuclease [Microbulbifer pacificus]|uniref:MAE_28990/MAE_18760 family HEPN-like nuclease n=1 Tax=Microbulbifer pacificus TaxID=407164 RepID=A0AAU0MZ64_9GAMM|nr:MAE_28990/MAE_18760 family HEPN-like nuclease [Microbulbifer pacificus]WOX05505.1 MAE_28990/MAE_18760 family HEPN-like nuclease [Microbulbifer pacificus]
MNDYESQIENDLLWREKELASLKRMAITSRNNQIAYRAILRASWATLYAHFEGFTKFAWELLLDKVESEAVPARELSEKFRALALEKPFKILRGDASSENLLSFFDSGMQEFLRSPVIFDPECRLSTDSNLWPNVFERECAKIGVASRELDNGRARIKALVARRNEIAHGKNMTVSSVDEYSEYEQAALLVMHDLALQVLDIIENRGYRVTNFPAQTITADSSE